MKQNILKWVVVCLLVLGPIGAFLFRFSSFKPERRVPLGAFDPFYSDKGGISPVIYEGIFPDNDEVRRILTEIRGEPVFAKASSDYHVTSLYYPKNPSPELYGKKVRIHLIGYQNETFLDENGRLTGAEGVEVKLECDDPELQKYFDKINRCWHITGSYMTDAVYGGVLNYDKAKPVDYTVEGTFGGYCVGNTVCYDAACIAGRENRFSRE